MRLPLTTCPLSALAITIMANGVTPAYGVENNTGLPQDSNPPSNDVEHLQRAYETRIQALEDRIKATEAAQALSQEETEALAISISQQANQTSANTYNPSIGVILNGRFLKQSPSDYEFNPPGFMLGEEPGPGEPGFGLGESELNLSANVDDKFTASITLAFGEETEVEEAYLQSIALPHGLGVKFGQFFSNLGYLNSHHAHSDDFSFRPLAQQAFLGPNFGDAGVQVTWLAPSSLFWESGVELYRGASFPAGGSADDGKGIWTAFTHIGGDVGTSQSWRSGISYMAAKVDNREDESSGNSFTGDSNLWIADFIWKWAPNGNSRTTNAKISAEYFYRSEKGEFTLNDSSNLSTSSHQSGWYLQAVYQFIPQWRFGMRYEQLDAENPGELFSGTQLDDQSHRPTQTSLMLDWSNSEFSRIRLQYSRDKSSPVSADLWVLQYVAAFGAHSAHAF